MTYVVHRVDAEGRTQLADVGSLEEALSMVERLRNAGSSTDVRVLKEVPIEVRTYYRVVAVEADAAASSAATDPTEPVPQDAVARAVREEPGAEVAPTTSAPASEPPRVTAVFGVPPSGATVMGPPPGATTPECPETAERAAQETRRPLFSRS